jgi:hypothetical protein
MQQESIKNEIPKIIIQQLEEQFDMTVNGSKVSIFAYIGAKQPFVYDENMVMFEVPKRKKIIITLNGNDLYNVELYSLKTFSYEEQAIDIFARNLKDTVFSLLGIE